jgi:hypothetical protein
VPQAGVVVIVQVWVKAAGCPPVHPDGNDEIIVLVWIPLGEQADQLEYSNEVQVFVYRGTTVKTGKVLTDPLELFTQ